MVSKSEVFEFSGGQKPPIRGVTCDLWCPFSNSYKRWCLWTRVKFRDNRLRNEVCMAVTPFQGRQKPPIRVGYIWPVMPFFKLVQEMMFVNKWVKFRDNRLRNEVCRAVTPFQYKQTYVRADPYIPCEGIITHSQRPIIMPSFTKISCKKQVLYKQM